MDLDAETAGAWLGRWWVEAALGLVALAGLAAGVLGGDLVRTVVALALAFAVADRLRLRLDNRSLADAVREVRDERVSAVRRETGVADADARDGTTPGTDGEDGSTDAESPRAPADEG